VIVVPASFTRLPVVSRTATRIGAAKRTPAAVVIGGSVANDSLATGPLTNDSEKTSRSRP
jgi:hypothetical protein